MAAVNDSSVDVTERAWHSGPKVPKEGSSSSPSRPLECEGQVGSFTCNTMFGHSSFVAGPYPCLSCPHIISLTTALLVNGANLTHTSTVALCVRVCVSVCVCVLNESL